MNVIFRGEKDDFLACRHFRYSGHSGDIHLDAIQNSPSSSPINCIHKSLHFVTLYKTRKKNKYSILPFIQYE